MNNMSPIRLRLAELLRERNISQVRLAEMTGLSENSISKLTGSPRQIRMDTIETICKVLDVEPGDLIVRDQDD